jgi:GxxExxY protein
MLLAHLTNSTLGSFFQVYRCFGFGFLERNYSNAMAVELAFRGLRVRREVPTEVVYRGVSVGRFRLDLVVEERLIVEVKAARTLVEADERQLLNYLKATRFEVGLLLNFGPEPKFRRLVYANDRK